jgi:hypothetical protein
MHNSVQNSAAAAKIARREPVAINGKERGYSDQPRANRENKPQRAA